MYAYCGTYRLDGSKLLAQPDVAWTPNWTKREHNSSWNVNGKVLTIETLPFKSQLDGVEVVDCRISEGVTLASQLRTRLALRR